MKAKSFHIHLLIALLPVSAFAQNESDALRFSYPLPGGTARSSALAGAFGALGADLSAAGTNPAGTALYRKSEVSISPSIEFNRTETDHYGTSTKESNARFFLNNAGFVINYGPKEGTKWQGSSFGIAFDRTRSLHFEMRAFDNDVPVSIADQFVDQANGVASSDLPTSFPFRAGLAWDAYVFDPDTLLANMYVSNFPAGSTFKQDHYIRTRGATSSTNLFFSANHDHRLFIGASIGIASSNYEHTIIHKEKTNDVLNNLQTLTYREDLTTSGSGLDFKLGLIYRIGENVRIGGAVHTPTGWALNDAYVTEVSSSFNSGTGPNGSDSYEILSPEGAYSYRVSTPWRFIASGAYIFGKKGLFSVDYEYLDLTSAKLKSNAAEIDGYDFNLENSLIEDRFQSAHVIRAGLEWRVGLIYLRAGSGIWPDAFDGNDIQSGDDLMMYAGGIGYRKAQLSFDLGIQTYQRSNNFFALSPEIIEMSEGTANSTRAIVTVSYRP